MFFVAVENGVQLTIGRSLLSSQARRNGPEGHLRLS